MLAELKKRTGNKKENELIVAGELWNFLQKQWTLLKI